MEDTHLLDQFDQSLAKALHVPFLGWNLSSLGTRQPRSNPPSYQNRALIHLDDFVDHYRHPRHESTHMLALLIKQP